MANSDCFSRIWRKSDVGWLRCSTQRSPFAQSAPSGDGRKQTTALHRREGSMSSQLHQGLSRRQVIGGAAGSGLALLTSRMLVGATFDPDEGTPTGTTESTERGEAASPTGESITLYNGQHRMADAICQAFTFATGIA